jgi:N,N'-diacetyllegionaminate synthase
MIIGNKNVNENPCIISFEIGATYSSFEEAKEMIKASANAGADAVKFQTFTPGDAERMLGSKDLKVDFTTSVGKKTELIINVLKKRELPKESWKILVDYAHELGLLFISTPENYPDSINFLVELGIDAIKITKGDINNVILIEQAAQSKLPVILDAREKISDVGIAIKICEQNANYNIMIMHCPSGYPAETSGIHLNAIKTIQQKFKYPVGYADHSEGSTINFASLALGVKMIEKTITFDKTIEEVEYLMSLNLDELKSFVTNIRMVESALGNSDILNTSRVEESNRRSIVVRKEIKKGQKITRDYIDFKRPGNIGISCSDGFTILDKIAVTNIPVGTFLQWNMLEKSLK